MRVFIARAFQILARKSGAGLTKEYHQDKCSRLQSFGEHCQSADQALRVGFDHTAKRK
jgi:hypothetical protein